MASLFDLQVLQTKCSGRWEAVGCKLILWFVGCSSMFDLPELQVQLERVQLA